MKNIFDLNYLFSVQPGSANLGFWHPVMMIATAAIVASIFAFFISRYYKADGLRRHLWQRYMAWGLTFGVVVLVLAFFRLQNAFLLSMRAFIFIWLAFSALWLIRIIMFHMWKYPKKLRARDEKAFFDKYLPHKKR
jgi:hypothetical protein